MPPRIDPARREIAVGTRRLPFRLDLRNDRVSVTLGGAETAVRPLQWREKVTLARFADLGPEFLRDEVIRLCTVSELPSPLDSEDAEVLWELAAWMSESPASAPVPLDSRSLATVTLRLCRAMGLKPADFDSRSAPEVEALWEALGQQAEEVVAEESSSSSTTRIVIVPDEAPRIAAVPAADREASRLPGGGRDAHEVARDPLPVPSPGPGQRATGNGGTAVRQVQQDQTQTSAVASSQSIGVVAMTSAMTRTAVTGESPADVIPRSTLGMTVAATATASAQPVHVPLVALVPGSIERGTNNGSRATSDVPFVPLVALVPESIERATDNGSRATPPAPHDFFEELADRLEQAAAEMGLGEE